MASIHKRKGKYNLIYTYTDRCGKKHQKWEQFNSYSDAVKRKKKIEYEASTGKQIGAGLVMMNDVLDDYLHVYGEHKWAPSTYNSSKTVIDLYIRPFLGNIRIDKITVKTIEEFYISLLTYKRERTTEHPRPRNQYVTPSTILSVHKVLRCIFNQAMKWGYISDNPCRLAERPKWRAEKRKIWDSETIFKAIDLCDDPMLKLAINLAFACSLRIGEMLGLTWDCVKIDPKSINSGKASIRVNKELQRVSAASLEKVGEGDIIKIFPSYVNNKKSTKLVLKTPKTESSVRTIYLPTSVANMLIKRYNDIIRSKKILGDEYIDHNMVFCYPNGIPMEESYIRRGFNKLIEDNDLPKVVFHSLRHSSITYKLKLTGGDIKAVQGDSGHSQVEMITEVYAHILDESRIKNAEIFEDEFYSDRKEEVKMVEKAEISHIGESSMSEEEKLVKQLSENPEAMKLIKALLNKSEKAELGSEVE